ncbi:MAG: hypothetical protein NZ740_02315 [Kiritimatiellae bacterium]|nr:hypothetical protein [Kiritimatiellia bacterium]MDW8457926.1 hypothetical protein [Verrucomicrobiota bacterium]
MKSVTLLCLAKDREATLAALRDLGILHLHPVRTPESRDLDQARARLAHITRALEVLPPKGDRPPSGAPPEQVVEKIWSLVGSLRDMAEELEELRQERRRIEPFGSFDPSVVIELGRRNIFIRLYQMQPDREPPDLPNAVVRVLHRDKSGVYFAVISREPVAVDAQEVRLPELSLNEIDRRIRDLEGRLASLQEALKEHAADARAVRELAEEAEDLVRFLEAREGMGSAEPIAFLRGYCPADQVEALRAAAARHGWGLRIRDPEPDEPVPTLIRNPAWVRPIQTVFKAIGIMPGYREIDISAPFLLFFSLFFAMLVGDAGYGALFLALTWLARRKLPSAPPEPFRLLAVLGSATILWGVLTGTYFGIADVPAPLARLRVAWLTDEDNIKHLCFLIGAIHLTLAHLWNAVRLRNSPQAIAQIGWTCTTWTMYFAARNMVLGDPFPGWVLWMFLAGVALIVLFMTPVASFKQEWFNHVMLPLNLVSNFVDVVSYLRLFAVGFASYAVASSFNEMGTAGSGFLSGIVGAFIIFFGHALNITLAAMGVLVHGIRLNTLEFSSHMGMQWTGRPYAPFQRRRRAPVVSGDANN